MGLNESKPEIMTKEKRVEREKAKVAICEERKQQIDNVQKQLLETSVKSNAIVNQKDIVNMIKITEKAKHQLDRVGSVLTKSDLVAIIIALNPELKTNISQLESLTVSDLNSMIRTIIYDPSRVVKNTKEDVKEMKEMEKLQNKQMNSITFLSS